MTVGQRRGLGTGGGPRDGTRCPSTRPAATVVAGVETDLLTDGVELTQMAWVGEGAGSGDVEAQSTAHGRPVAARLDGSTVVFDVPQRRVAPGQSVVLYRGDEVLGGGVAA